MASDSSLSVRWPIAAAIVILALALIGGKLWAAGRAAETHVVDTLRATPDGRLAARVGTRLYIGKPSAPRAKVIDLAALGADVRVPALAVFPDGDLLLWRAPRAEDAPSASPGHLARCDPDALRCRRFLDEADAPHPPLRLAVDRDGGVYVADSAEHRILAYTPDGERRSAFFFGLRFPTGLWLTGARLHLANTDAREIVSIATHPLGGAPSRRAFEAGPAVERHRPVALAPGGDDEWWVVGADKRLTGTSVHRIAPDGSTSGALALGDGAVPTAVLPHAGAIYVAGTGRFRIARFTPEGAPAGRIEWPALNSHLADLRAAHGRSVWLGHAAWTGFMALVGLGFLAGYRQGEVTRGRIDGVPLAAIGATSEAIEWLERNPKLPFRRRAILLLIAALLLVGAAPLLLTGVDRSTLALVGMCAAVAALLWLLSQPVIAARIGVHEGWLILDNGRRSIAGRGDAVVYTDEGLAIDDIAVPLGRRPYRLYVEAELVEAAYPLLRRATETTRGRMQLKILRSYPGMALALGLLLFGMLAWVGYFGP